MKLRFEADLAYQHAAIEAVCDLFTGQELGRTEFTVARAPVDQSSLDLDGRGHGNALKLLDEELLTNLRAVQARQGLPLAVAVDPKNLDFTVEMETGTGKTYVYLRTIFEMNRRYGWTKFVIVVPSVAIREGVAKTLETTRDHFRALFAGQPMDWFVYDSTKLGQVRDFATSATIKVMVATIGSLNKVGAEESAGNVFYRPHEKTGGDRPVDLVRATRPVIIIDEPQSVEGADPGSAGAKALRGMNPLCRLRYSATHVREFEMVYRLDAFDAHAQGLVKEIVVAGAEVIGAHNAPYVRLMGVTTRKNQAPEARVEVDVQRAQTVQREEITVRDGDSLEDRTGRQVYRNLQVGTIEKAGRAGRIELQVPGDVVWLEEGQAHGDLHVDDVARKMIQQTIREHFERELRLKPLGIKVLSLFFVDRVESYRVYNADGSTSPGRFGRMFEEEYLRLARHPDFRTTLFANIQPDPAAAHDGYFSRDRHGRVAEIDLNASGEPRNAAAREAAERGFKLIMQEKERLLDEREPLRFIFSHSALREGWDNPNVFQICVLREMGGERQRRQTIGRGLRLCVDSNGDRRRDEGLNSLTVVADENFETYASALQKEMESDLGHKFGVVEGGSFATLTFLTPEGAAQPLGMAESQALFQHLQEAGLVNGKGEVQDDLRRALSAGTLKLPERFEAVASAVRGLLGRLAGKVPIRNRADRRTVGINRQVYLGDDFRALWDMVKSRTTYRLDFDPEALIAAAAEEIRQMPAVARAQIRFRRAQVVVERDGLEARGATTTAQTALTVNAEDLPDILGELQERTGLIRCSLVRILEACGKIDEVKSNPAAFLDATAAAIGRAKRKCLVDGVVYVRLGDQEHFAQELLKNEEITGYLTNLLQVRKSVTEAVVYDSLVERSFAEQLEQSQQVKVFAKLPGWFTVPTPLGSYNPDWAVLVTSTEGEKLYFVVETKGTNVLNDLRDDERAKIDCGRKHFAAIEQAHGQPCFVVASDLSQVLADGVT